MDLRGLLLREKRGRGGEEEKGKERGEGRGGREREGTPKVGSHSPCSKS